MHEKSLLEVSLILCRNPSFFSEDSYLAHVCKVPRWNSDFKEADLELQDIPDSSVRSLSGKLFRFRARLHRTQGHDDVRIGHIIRVFLQDIEEININAGISESHVSLRRCRVGACLPLIFESISLDPCRVCLLKKESSPSPSEASKKLEPREFTLNCAKMKNNFSLFNPQKAVPCPLDTYEDFLSPELEDNTHPVNPVNRPAVPPSRPRLPQNPPKQRGGRNYFGPPDMSSANRGYDPQGGRNDKPPMDNNFDGYRIPRGNEGNIPDENYRNSPPVAVPYTDCRQPGNAGPVVRRNDPQTIPIHKLDRFVAKWAVKGRFINKGEARVYKNKSGEGRVWSVDLIDSAHPKGCIRCTFFNAAVDKFLDTIQEGHIYRVSRGRLKEKDKRFNQLPHDCELTLGDDAEIVWLAVDDPKIPYSAARQLTKIRNLIKKDKGDTVSVMGVVIAKAGPIQITRRSTGEPTTKCDITLADDSMAAVEVSIWGNRCSWVDAINVDEHPVVLAEGCRVDEFNGRRLATVGQSSLIISPPGQDTAALSSWWKHSGCLSVQQFQVMSKSDWGEANGTTLTVNIREMLKRLAQPEDSAALEDKGVYFAIRGTLAEILKHRPFYYLSCPTCRKKVNVADAAFEEDGNQQAFCDRCNVAVETPIKQYLLNIRVADATGCVDVTAMTDTGKAVMGGVSADTLYEMQAQGGNCVKSYDDLLEQRCRREYLFKIRVKTETYRDETKLRYQVVTATPLSGYDTKVDPEGPIGMNTARRHIIKEAGRIVQNIYDVIERDR